MGSELLLHAVTAAGCGGEFSELFASTALFMPCPSKLPIVDPSENIQPALDFILHFYELASDCCARRSIRHNASTSRDETGPGDVRCDQCGSTAADGTRNCSDKDLFPINLASRGVLYARYGACALGPGLRCAKRDTQQDNPQFEELTSGRPSPQLLSTLIGEEMPAAPTSIAITIPAPDEPRPAREAPGPVPQSPGAGAQGLEPGCLKNRSAAATKKCRGQH